MSEEIKRIETTTVPDNNAWHSMTRRSVAHDYTRPGTYHITIHVTESLGQPLGAVVGNLSAPDGSADAPRTVLSAVGQMVEHELLTAIHAHYSMITIQDYVIMPDHLHFLAVVQDLILSSNGKRLPIGHVIGGFKKGCNKRYWEMTGQTAESMRGNNGGQTAESTRGNNGGQTAAHTSQGGAGSVTSGFPAGYKVPSSASTGRTPLFAPNYCDVMPVDAAQLATQRAYIKSNPRSRLQRMSHRSWLTVQRGIINTALTPAALRGFLQRECAPHQATPEALAAIEGRLLITTSGQTAAHAPQGSAGSVPSGFPAGKNYIACDTFGNHALLTERRCLPVVCHRRDAARFSEQKRRCQEEATQGAVLVSASISPKEREIITDTVNHGFPVITIHDNGFPDRFHPSAERQALCAEGRLLLVSPWQYQYRGKNEQVTVPFSKAMNCVAQALCRTKDTWWQTVCL